MVRPFTHLARHALNILRRYFAARHKDCFNAMSILTDNCFQVPIGQPLIHHIFVYMIKFKDFDKI